MHGKQKQSQRFSRNHSYFLHLNLLFLFSLEKALQKIFMSVSKLIMCFTKKNSHKRNTNNTYHPFLHISEFVQPLYTWNIGLAGIYIKHYKIRSSRRIPRRQLCSSCECFPGSPS